MDEPLWLIDEILRAAGGRAEGALPQTVSGVSIDSRTIKLGELFIAIHGEHRDGNAFVSHAFAAGAALAIVSESFAGHSGGPLIRVTDTLEALNALGRAARARSSARVIAVTGSAGKTGAKEMLRLALGKTGPAHASGKSYNNLWGVPLSLARMPRQSRFGVFEIGMNHAGEITPLAGLVRPHIAIITTVAPVHIEFFPSVAAIAEAKAEVFHGLEPGGAAILNRDSEHFAFLEKRAKEAGALMAISFGAGEKAAARLVMADLEPDRSFVTAEILGEPVDYEIGAAGGHLVMNSLAVLAAAKLAGADVKLAAASLRDFTAPPGRGARLMLPAGGGGRLLVIDESYNANPASMRAALAVLGRIPRADFSRRVAVLGDMLELGHASQELHAELAETIDAAGIDVVFGCGAHMAALYERLPSMRRGSYAKTSDELREPLLEAVRAGDAVMIKGSLGSRMGPLVNALKAKFTAAASDGAAAADG